MVEEQPPAEFGEDPATPSLEPRDPSHGGLADLDPWIAPLPAQRAPSIPWAALKEVLDVAAIALVMFIGVRFAAHNYVVDGGSMMPTFEDGQFLIVNRLAYRSFDLSWVPFLGLGEVSFGKPESGDVIVFQFDPQQHDFIKRVIAVPGETVAIHDGHVFLNGVEIQEDYVADLLNHDYPPTVVPEGMLFVLGDNRNNSYDSSRFGLIEQSAIVGRADLRYWPLSSFGLVGHRFGHPVGTEVTASP